MHTIARIMATSLRVLSPETEIIARIMDHANRGEYYLARVLARGATPRRGGPVSQPARVAARKQAPPGGSFVS